MNETGTVNSSNVPFQLWKYTNQNNLANDLNMQIRDTIDPGKGRPLRREVGFGHR
jgi:hypothetical protein